jgi:lipoprotein NlpI
MMRSLTLAFAVAALTGGNAAAQSQASRLCAAAASGEAGRSVEACSQLLAAPSLAKRDRALAYINRGTGHLRLGNDDFAIRDYDAAIGLAPGDVRALNLRGDALSRKGDFARALADYSEAIRLNPLYPLALRNRARIYFYRGDFAAAAEDFRTAEQVDRANGYSLLWRYVAEARAGFNDRAGLIDGFRLLREGWPKPIAQYYLARMSEALLLTMAAADRDKQRERECEAHFFIGQRHIVDGASGEAVAALRKALAVCPPEMVEHQAARVELGRLGAPAQ